MNPTTKLEAAAASDVVRDAYEAMTQALDRVREQLARADLDPHEADKLARTAIALHEQVAVHEKRVRARLPAEFPPALQAAVDHANRVSAEVAQQLRRK